MRVMLATLLCAFCTSAFGATCAEHDAMIQTLETQYGETTQVRAMSGTGGMMEITANLGTGTWSALMTDPSGKTCVVAAGDRFKPVKQGDPA